MHPTSLCLAQFAMLEQRLFLRDQDSGRIRISTRGAEYLRRLNIWLRSLGLLLHAQPLLAKSSIVWGILGYATIFESVQCHSFPVQPRGRIVGQNSDFAISHFEYRRCVRINRLPGQRPSDLRCARIQTIGLIASESRSRKTQVAPDLCSAED